jgi:hypothetical protein
MAYRRRRSRNDNDPVAGAIASLICIYLLWMGLLYFSDRAAYWQQLGYSIVFVIIIIGAAVGLLKFLSKRRRNRLDGILNALQEHGLEGDVNSFIDSFGLEKKTAKSWRYDRYSFSWEQLERFRKMLNEKGMRLSTSRWDDLSFVLKHYIDEKEDRFMRDSVSIAPRRFADLSGSDFENLLCRLFSAMGYSVQRTGKTGDQGCDLVVNMGNDRVVVQAKRYSNSVGNAAVQEANAAKPIYNCGKAMVVASSDFTKEAFDAARANGVELIDKEKLSGWLLQYLNQNWK